MLLYCTVLHCTVLYCTPASVCEGWWRVVMLLRSVKLIEIQQKGDLFSSLWAGTICLATTAPLSLSAMQCHTFAILHPLFCLIMLK